MRLIISSAALFLSVLLLQLSSGGVAPLDALAGLSAGFSPSEVGLLGSAHFMGFLIGCWWAPRLMGAVGHSRSFAAFTALGAIGILGHTMTATPWAWALLRIGSGLCIAGCYTVVEAWLQAKVTNETRGRMMGTYRIVDTTGSLAAQLMIGVLADLPTYLAYNTLTLAAALALLPLLLTTAAPPAMRAAPRLRPAWAFRLSPLATYGVLVSAVSGASFRMAGPIYGQEVGLSPDQIGLFLAAFVLGGAVSQYPAGWLADRFDRRWVLIWVSVASLVACGLTWPLSFSGTWGVLAGATVFGLTTFPVYSISAAHAHDFAGNDQRVELSAALLFFYAAGAIAAPYVAATLIERLGAASMFGLIGLAHAGLAGYGFYRMRVRSSPARRTPYVWTPRTSFTVGRLTKEDRQPDGEDG